MVNCPECGKPLRKNPHGLSKYYCEDERCIVAFVCYPNEPNRTRIAYTGFAWHKPGRFPPKEPLQRSIKEKLGLF